MALETEKQKKKVVLDLGGLDTFIFLKSGIFDEASKNSVFARMQNN